MTKRFENLKKIPPDPAARMLALANTKLLTPLRAPASASVSVVLEELEEKGAVFDILHMLAVALPEREATWWACMAARDIVGIDVKPVPPPLDAAEKWVFKPTEENRIQVQKALENAEVDDDTVNCAMAALYADGSLGPGELSGHPAPPSAVSTAVFAMNMMSLRAHVKKMEAHGQMLIDRGLDIARGGNGRVDAAKQAVGGDA